MTWDAISAIGQAISALALFGVLMQVRQASAEVRRSISHNRLEAIRGLNVNRMNNERLIGIAMKTMAAIGARLGPFQVTLVERFGLTPEEATTLHMDQGALWQCYAEAIPYADQMQNSERTVFDMNLRNVYRDPIGALWYDNVKTRLNPEAVRYVDNLLAQPGS